MILIVPPPTTPYCEDCRNVLIATRVLSRCPYRCPADSVVHALEHSGWAVRRRPIDGLPVWDQRKRTLWASDLQPHALAVQLGHLRLHRSGLQSLTVGQAWEAAEWASAYLMPEWIIQRLRAAYYGPPEDLIQHMARWCRVPEEAMRYRLRGRREAA